MYYKPFLQKRPFMRLAQSLISSLLFLGLLSGCHLPDNHTYRKVISIPDAQWYSTYQPQFTIDISDTSATYVNYLLIRHDNAYPYSNLWFRLSLQADGSQKIIHQQRIEVQLAGAGGEWRGKGIGGMWEHKITLPHSATLQFPKVGRYHITMEQIMRDEPLTGVLDVGLEIKSLQ